MAPAGIFALKYLLGGFKTDLKGCMAALLWVSTSFVSRDFEFERVVCGGVTPRIPGPLHRRCGRRHTRSTQIGVGSRWSAVFIRPIASSQNHGKARTHAGDLQQEPM